MAQSFFPRNDIPVYEKTEAWLKQHLDFAETLLRNYNSSRTSMTEMYNSYNGIKKEGAMDWLEKRYGKQNKAKFTPFRLGRTKMNLLHGEFLKRPLTATVTTINSEAMSSKMQELDFMIGAMLAQDEIKSVKEKAGIDIMEGAPIPKNEQDPIWSKMSPKDKQEDVMQIILDEEVKALDLKKRLSDCFLDLLITGMCYCKCEINEVGETKFYRIDPRDAIFEHIEGDDYLEESPVRGCRQTLTVHEILLRYNLSPDDRQRLENARKNPGDFLGVDGYGRGYMRMSNGQLVCDVVHIEWDSLEAEYTKISPKTKSQMELNPEKENYRIEIDPASYEQGIEAHNENVKAGKYKIETKFKTVVYEATRIGGCIDVNMRKKYWQKRDEDNASVVLNSSYHGYIHGTVNGTRISLQKVIENFDTMYDVVMYQINKDVARAKGKALFYDRAGMPADRNTKTVMYQIFNDGYVDWNSAASGNYSQKNLEMSHAIKEIDLGLSASFEYLVAMKNQIVQDLNQITGINENRQGDIAASSTATNANSAIAASRTITEPIFAGMEGFTKKVVQNIVDTAAISWAFYKVEKGEQILGSVKHGFLKATKELGYRNYGVHMEDGGKYAEMKQVMRDAMNISLNAKELRPIDFYKVSVAETMAQAERILISSWEEMQAAVLKSNQENNRVQMEMKQAELKNQVQIADADREDRQVADKDNIITKGKVQMEVDNNKGRNKMLENHQSAENDLIISE